MDPKEIVSEGYDRIADTYAEWAPRVRVEERARYTARIVQALPEGASLLELGCGSGLPTTQLLASRYQVTGVDISARQVELARMNVPDATFIQADMTTLDFPAASFDGIAAFYALTHVPRDHQGAL
ncbi:MAG TPA: class I SAM-dependent methyltransferase, partial [Thermomicrobiales bacterium]|nr:class I SAM-dependent methyltransferase [Thermomicrobiales bacterium]